MIILWVVAAIVVGAGIVSIAGALRRAVQRPAAGRRQDDGPVIMIHGDCGRGKKSPDNNADSSDGPDGGGDGGGGGGD